MSSTLWRARRRGERPVIYGRDRERAQLRELLDDAIAGHGSLVLISGEAGIGKTTLVDDLIHEAEERDCLVLTGGCYDLTTTPPYGPWAEMLRGYPDADDLPSLPPQLREGTEMEGVGSQAALFELVRQFFDAVAAARVLVLTLEDLHWSDTATLDLVRYLGRTLNEQRLLIVGTYRDDEITRRHELYQLLPVLTREAGAARIMLQRLDDVAITDLLLARYELPGTDLKRLAMYLQYLSEGNPFFASELLRTLEDNRVLTVTSQEWKLGDLADVSVPPVVREVIESRLGRLGEESRAILEIAAVIGQSISFDLWQAMTDLAEGDLISITEDALRLQILVEDNQTGHVRFSHALIRETLYEGVMSLRRRTMHRQIGELLAVGNRPDPDAIADHFLRGGDSRAVDWLIQAADRAERLYALVLAADRLNQAQELLEGDDDRLRERGWIVYRIARLNRQSDTSRALEYFSAVEEIGEYAGDEYLSSMGKYQRGFMHCFLEEWSLGIPLMLESLPTLSRYSIDADMPAVADGPVSVTESHPMGHIVVMMSTGRYQDALPLLELYVENHGEHPDLCHELGEYNALRGNRSGAAGCFERAIALQDARSHYHLAAVARGLMIRNLFLTYLADQADELRNLANETRAVWKKASEGAWKVQRPPRLLWNVDLHFGLWSKAESQAGQAAEDTAYRIYQLDAIGCLARLSLFRGNFADVEGIVRRVLPRGAETEPGSHNVTSALKLLRVVVETGLQSGNLNSALGWLSAYDRWLDWCEAVLGRSESSLLRASCHRLSEELGEARICAERAHKLASNPRQPLALIAADRFLGQLDVDQGKYDEAKRRLDASLELAERCEAPFEQALTLVVMAERAAKLGDAEESREFINRVREICEPLGAKPTLERVGEIEAMLPGARRSSEDHPFGLTGREVEVLRLVARGRTDAEAAEELFISPRTVSQHLRNAYNKIGVNNRAEATRVAVEQGIV